LKGGLLRELTSLKVLALIIAASVIFFDFAWIIIYSGVNKIKEFCYLFFIRNGLMSEQMMLKQKEEQEDLLYS